MNDYLFLGKKREVTYYAKIITLECWVVAPIYNTKEWVEIGREGTKHIYQKGNTVYVKGTKAVIDDIYRDIETGEYRVETSHVVESKEDMESYKKALAEVTEKERKYKQRREERYEELRKQPEKKKSRWW